LIFDLSFVPSADKIFALLSSISILFLNTQATGNTWVINEKRTISILQLKKKKRFQFFLFSQKIFFPRKKKKNVLIKKKFFLNKEFPKKIK